MAESGEACVTSLTGDVLLYQEDSEDMMKIKRGPDQTVCRVAPTQKDKLYIYAHDGWVCMNRMGAFSDDVYAGRPHAKRNSIEEGTQAKYSRCGGCEDTCLFIF